MQKFYICSHCGNLVGMIHASGVPMICCGEPMKELVPNTTDAAQEKHVPEVTVNGDTVEVSVGSVIHPMTDAHYIQWIYLQTDKGGQRRALTPADEPKAAFKLACACQKPVAVYAYCNLHGLWMKQL